MSQSIVGYYKTWTSLRVPLSYDHAVEIAFDSSICDNSGSCLSLVPSLGSHINAQSCNGPFIHLI